MKVNKYIVRFLFGYIYLTLVISRFRFWHTPSPMMGSHHVSKNVFSLKGRIQVRRVQRAPIIGTQNLKETTTLIKTKNKKKKTYVTIIVDSMIK